jgi:hypothetical protein
LDSAYTVVVGQRPVAAESTDILISISLEVDSAETCAQQCTANATCTSFSYALRKKRCALYTAAPITEEGQIFSMYTKVDCDEVKNNEVANNEVSSCEAQIAALEAQQTAVLERSANESADLQEQHATSLAKRVRPRSHLPQPP